MQLKEILRIRATGEWSRYVGALQGLLEDPLAFSDPKRGAPAVYQSYVDLARVSTKIAAKGKAERRTAHWMPCVELIVEVAGAALSVLWAEETVYKVVGEVSNKVGQKPAPVVVRLVVRGLTERDLVRSWPRASTS